jgi:hypothetical protein
MMPLGSIAIQEIMRTSSELARFSCDKRAAMNPLDSWDLPPIGQ